jgi:hypothetical protein
MDFVLLNEMFGPGKRSNMHQFKKVTCLRWIQVLKFNNKLSMVAIVEEHTVTTLHWMFEAAKRIWQYSYLVLVLIHNVGNIVY